MITKISAKETVEGDGVIVNRLFPIPNRMNFDPFVLWDHFDIGAGHGFPDHPHRGFEAITYMLGGGMNHKDNLGNDAFVAECGAQVFCAGNGIVHSEMPAESGNSTGIQLWINLPKRLKKIDASYQQIISDQLPLIEFEGGNCRTIVGEGSPITLHTEITYQHVHLDGSQRYQIYMDTGLSAIIYVLKGSIQLCDESIDCAQAALITADSEENLSINASEDSEFMFCSGYPHNEPIYQHGTYVD